ncbi:hypothetical protein RKLH11_2797 [Rhodobacteraceae bacterium KLH11]|nr:hypothetical protein RKLH11_2797 [Rhodobacteraceae bacterium KLH11]
MNTGMGPSQAQQVEKTPDRAKPTAQRGLIRAAGFRLAKIPH